jgi:hypothetical protein
MTEETRELLEDVFDEDEPGLAGRIATRIRTLLRGETAEQ